MKSSMIAPPKQWPNKEHEKHAAKQQEITCCTRTHINTFGPRYMYVHKPEEIINKFIRSFEFVREKCTKLKI